MTVDMLTAITITFNLRSNELIFFRVTPCELRLSLHGVTEKIG